MRSLSRGRPSSKPQVFDPVGEFLFRQFFQFRSFDGFLRIGRDADVFRYGKTGLLAVAGDHDHAYAAFRVVSMDCLTSSLGGS